MNEKLIESKLREAVRKMGGLAIKLNSVSFTGLPDRMVLMPGGRITFAELKSTGKKPTPRQLVVIRMLMDLGFTVWVIDNEQELDRFIENIKRAGHVG